MSLEERFWMKVNKGTLSQCWEWTASLDSKGYGKIGSGGREGQTLRASRVSALIHRLKDPMGKVFALSSSYCVLHKNECHNRKCVNPNHLYIGTQKDNIQDSVSLTTHNTAKLSDDEVKEMRNLYKQGWKQKDLVSRFKVKRLQVYRICNYKQRTKT